MKTIELANSAPSLQEILAIARKEALLLRTESGEEFFLGTPDELRSEGRFLQELPDDFGTDARMQPTDAEKQAARERFERHFGEVDLGYATGVDNEQIDADLARAYAARHREY